MRSAIFSMLVAAAAAAIPACATGDDELEFEPEPAEDDFVFGTSTPYAATPGNWNPPPDVRAIGATAHIPYEGPPAWNGGKNCGGSLLAGTRQLGDFLKAQFPGVSSYGGYACRQNTANKAQTSVHGTGRAIDVFIPLDGGAADNGKGDPVANWLISHAQEIGVQYIIWDRTDWSGGHAGDKLGRYGGPVPHIDHLHVELTHAGANRQTPWFNAPTSSLEGSAALAWPGQQHVFERLNDGSLRHLFWDAGLKVVARDTWGTGVAGQAAGFTTATQQHVWARGIAGTLDHWFWEKSNNKVTHDVWGAGIAGDPAVAAIGDQQHAWAVDGPGTLHHYFWSPANGLRHDVWGAGVIGRPSVLVVGDQQHVFARGRNGGLEHFYWSPGKAIAHDTWINGIAGDPASARIGTQQHVWAIDGAGALQHAWWDPKTGIGHDTWGLGVTGRPTVMIDGDQQHVFARGANGALEHWYWSPSRGLAHDTWGGGIVSDPVSLVSGAQQHVWALDAANNVQHWFWDPYLRTIVHDGWGR